MPQEESKYSLLEGQYKSDSDDESLQLPRPKPHARWSPFFRLSLGANILLGATALFLALGSSIWKSSFETNVDQKRTSFYSPILDRFEIPMGPKQMSGELFPKNPPSIYRQDPSPELEAEWDRIGSSGKAGGFLILYEDEVERLGKDPDKAVRAPEDWGYGSDAYVGSLDVFHQLHCVNELRMAAWYDEYHQPGSEHAGKDHPLYWIHLKHCVDMLVQNIKCTASVDIITQKWVDQQYHPFPDFNIYHQCRDFEAILDWQIKNRVTDKFNWTRPDDAVVQPLQNIPPGALVNHHITDGNHH